MGNFDAEIVGGVGLGLGLWWYASNKIFTIYTQKLQYAKNSFEDAQFIHSLNLVSNHIRNTYEELSKRNIPKYLLILDPIKYYSLKKEFNSLNRKSSKKLEEMDSA